MTAQQGFTLSRRRFLVGSTAGGLLMAFGGVGIPARSARAALTARAYEPTVWLQINPDGRILVNIAKAEMGQHVGTALARVVAEELEADWSDVEIVHVDSDPKWGYMITGASWSVHTSFEPLSRAGAAGRIALIEAGAALLGVAPEECVARSSSVIAGGRSVSYAQIVHSGMLDRSFSEEELKAIALKPASDRRLLGKQIRALDIPAKTDGSAVFGIDAKVAGMVYARPVIPPTRYGCVIRSVDDSAARSVPGYLRTVTIEDPSNTCQGWLAVVADSYYAALKAADLLRVDWQPGPGSDVDEAAIQQRGAQLANDSAGSLWVHEGDIAQAFADADQILDHTYRTASVLHMTLEPVNALALEQDGHWHIHAGNQWQSLILPVLSQALEVPQERITLHQYHLGGGFGRRLWGDYMVPAALTAKAIGRPVKMVFTREDDARFDCPRSPTVQRLRSALNRDGQITAWDHAAVAGWPTEAMAPAFLKENVAGGGKSDIFAANGADHWYSIANQRVRAIKNDLAQETFLPGWLRAVGAGWLGWAVESHLDELAVAAGRDPVEFRLALLDAKGRNAGQMPESVGGAARLAAVLRRAAELADWNHRGKLPKDNGLGVALCAGQERAMPTWVATIARVSVNRATGAIRVEKITSVADAGTIVHPDGALAQMESATLWGLSMALYESTEFKAGQVADRNLHSYRPLRMDQVPELEIDFIRNHHMPTGLGEPAVIPVAAAIANAVYDAVGIRLRDLPLRPDALKAALISTPA